MYALIIFIHVVFMGINHFLGNRLLVWIFFLLGIFFLFYFSPLFFLDDEAKWRTKSSFSPKKFLEKISPRNSMLLPSILLYIAIYSFIYAIFRVGGDILHFHTGVVIVLYLLFFVYGLIFYWKNDIFFEFLRFHTLFTLISTVILTLSLILEGSAVQIFHPIVWIIWVLAGTFLLSYVRQENPVFLSSYIAGIGATSILVGLFIFPAATLIQIAGVLIILSIIIFEYFPRLYMFSPYSTTFRYFSLISLLFSLLPALWFAWTEVDSFAIWLLALTVLFFLSIHRRYTNYVVYVIAVFEIFFIYSLVFLDLLHASELTSLSLFIFFLPILVIGSTFFYDEAHIYDFPLLHYSSIAFSMIFSIYAIFFIWWGGDILLVISLCVFGIALLFFLSYFRLRPTKNLPIHL
jgi:hypothetical protein